MSRSNFIESRREAWKQLEELLARLRTARRRHTPLPQAAQFPSRYRRLCQDLSLVRHRRYGLGVAARLNDLALAGYHVLHGVRPSPLRSVAAYLVGGFPREVRSNAALFALCNLLFWGPFLLLMLAGVVAPEWVLAVVGPESRQQLTEHFGGAAIVRDAGSDVQMFAFYVWNNVGIDFRVFAGGMAFGLGTLYYIVVNGIQLGAAFGYALQAGLEDNFLAFTAGHGSLELMAIVVSAMAGLKVASGLVAPGRMTRAHALRVRAIEGVRLLFGAAAMTTGAACIEGFWSASPLSNEVKYIAGAIGWVLVLAYFAFGGRRAAH